MWGKNSTSTQDTYFNKYIFEYLNEDYKMVRMNLKFKESNFGGEMYIDENSPRKEAFIITDELTSEVRVILTLFTPTIIKDRPYKLVFFF